MAQLMEAWNGLLNELGERAPVSLAAVRPGSAEGPIIVERELGIALPAELREWFTLHDGCGLSFKAMILPSSVPMSPLEAVQDTKMIYEIWSEQEDQTEFASEDPGPAGTIAYTWLREFVMVGSDGCGGGLFVDVRSGPQQGCVRFWDKTEADDDYGEGPIAPSLAALFRSITASIRDSSSTTFGYHAVIEDGSIEWRMPDDAGL